MFTATRATKANPQEGLVDLYGFHLVGLTETEHRTREECAGRAVKTASKWSDVAVDDLRGLRNSNPEKLKRLVREGIPPKLRPLAWWQLSGAEELKLAAGADYYLQVAKAAGATSFALTQVEADLSALVGSHPLAFSKKSLESVRRIVLAYGYRNPEVGYNAFVCNLAFFLLLVVGFKNEETAFWLLASLVENVLPAGYYEDSKGCAVEQRVFEVLLAKKCPNLTTLFRKLEVDVSSVTSTWFSGLFIKTLPAETTARVWDWLFGEGPKVLFRVALAVLKMNEVALLHTFHSSQLPRTLQWRVTRTYHADALSKMAFKGIGSLSMVVINKNRAFLEGEVRAEIDAHKRRLAALYQSNKHGAVEYCLNSIAEERSSM